MELFQTSNEFLKRRIENLEEKVKFLEDPNKFDKGNITNPNPDISEALVCEKFENKDDLKCHIDAHHDKIVQPSQYITSGELSRTSPWRWQPN